MDEREAALWREVGARIRHYRRSQGMSVDKLAAKVGIVRQQIVKLEAGQGGTTVVRLQKIAEALGVTIHDLLPGPRPQTDEDIMYIAFRGRGLSEQEIEEVLKYIDLLERARPRKHD